MKFLKYFFFGYVIAAIVTLAIVGIRGPARSFTVPPMELYPDMHRQPKYKAQSPSAFFADGRSDRSPVPGTEPFSVPLQSTYYASGIIEGHWGDGFPQEITVDADLLKRGQERFNINCAICHGPAGYGDGVTTKLGLVGVANMHQDLVMNMEDGRIFYTITHGKGNMGSYADHLTIKDRWAVVAYVRALQRTTRGSLETPMDVKPESAKTEPAKVQTKTKK